MDDEIRIRVSDIIFALKKHWKIIVATSFTGILIGMALTAMSYMQSTNTTYRINGSFAINAMNEKGLFMDKTTSPTSSDYHLAESMVQAIRYMVNSRLVVTSVIDEQRLIGITPGDIQHNISLEQYGDTQIIDMTLVWRSPEEGIEIWNALVDTANRYIPQILKLGTLVVINEALASQVGVTRAGPKMPILMTGLGVLAGLGFALISVLLHPTLNNLKDVDAVLGMETLGMIPQSLSWSEQNGKILTKSRNPDVDESYSAAAYILRNRLGTREKHHCFYVTSTTSKEGKSAVSANLAIQLSGMECHTLLIDFDTRNPDVGPMFLADIDYACSLNALYRGDANEYDVITHINGYLDLMMMIPEHNPIPLDGTIEELFTKLADKYEYVVINASPVGIVSETLSLNQVTNNALFVVGYDSATISDIQASIQKMDKSGTRMIGCIVNGVQARAQYTGDLLPSFLSGKGQQNHQSKKDDDYQADGDGSGGMEDDLASLTSSAHSASKDASKGRARSKEKPGMGWLPKGKKKSTGSGESMPSEPSESRSESRNLMEELIANGPDEDKPASSDDMLAALLQGHDHKAPKENAEASKEDSDASQKNES